MTIATFEQEDNLLASGYDFVLGVDEAGRGPLAGPVVAAVCMLKPETVQALRARSNGLLEPEVANKRWNFIRDSKTLSEKQREAMFDFIREHFFIGVGICDHHTIDRMNVLEASFLAMKKAIAALNFKFPTYLPVDDVSNAESQPEADPPGTEIPNSRFKNAKKIILVDGNKVIPNFSMEQLAIVSGDKLVKSIAAASIVAKVRRDRIIREADKLYPEYGFAKHKGYGTKLHLDALKKYGPCEIHRKTFAPVKDLL